MSRALALLLIGLATPTFADDARDLTPVDCPYAEGDIPEHYSAKCHRMAWADSGTDYSTTVAVLTPAAEDRLETPVIYSPGGPGDAPVNENADIVSILALLPDRVMITLNPRGVKGAAPRPQCEFDPDFWREELTSEREDEITRDCREAVTLRMDRLDAPVLAQDIDAMVRALEIERAGIFGISYGTESVLHLLVEQPEWLAFAILDSVSLPGKIGTVDRLRARDRFLGIIDRLCFEERQCPDSLVDGYDDLLGWTAQFDEKPVKVELGPKDEPWLLDGQDMLDFLASMSSYPDGAGYGPVFIEVFEESPAETAEWVDTELESSINYALENFALLYGAFSDSAERNNPIRLDKPLRYPVDLEEQQDMLRLLNIWNREGRTEEAFIDSDSAVEQLDMPVLVVSGGADSLTPLKWAFALDRRFTGFTHFVFPDLGHAVAFGTDADVNDEEVARQLNCGPAVVSAFLADGKYGSCNTYLRDTNDE